jgi:diketogulonate reductase-like aldo/keto reductase
MSPIWRAAPATQSSVSASTRRELKSTRMEHRPLGPLDVKVPVIGQGTWYIEEADRAAAMHAIRLGLDQGMTHVDTAELYGWGAAEEMVGEALAGRRDEVFLVSKVVPEHASRRGTIAACEASLARLNTDWLDCYLLHWRGQYPLAETFEAFDQLQREGKIRSWGVSNFDVDDLEEAWGLVGEGEMACNQVLYNLTERAIEHAVLPWCEQHNVAVVGYAPFGHGNFPGPNTSGGRVLQEIAAAHNATPRQVALRFLVRRPLLFTIPKASRPEHALENAGAGSLRLSSTEIELIDKAFPRGPRPHQLPVL